MTKSRTLPALFFAGRDRGRFPPSPRPGLRRTSRRCRARHAGPADHRHRRRGDRDGPGAGARRSSTRNVRRPLNDEVVVCGRRQGFQRYRVPMTRRGARPGTGERAGDAQLYAMEASKQRCSAVGRDQACGGGLDLIGIGFTIVRGNRAGAGQPGLMAGRRLLLLRCSARHRAVAQPRLPCASGIIARAARPAWATSPPGGCAKRDALPARRRATRSSSAAGWSRRRRRLSQSPTGRSPARACG